MPDLSPLQHGVTLRENDRQFYAKLITLERQHWRERIRQLCISATRLLTEKLRHESDRIELQAIRSELVTRLNMGDEDDRRLIQCLDDAIECQAYRPPWEEPIYKFQEEVSWLLKEDWERVKHDCRPLWHWYKVLNKVDRVNKLVLEKPIVKKQWLWGVFTFALLLGMLFALIWVTGSAYQLTQPDSSEAAQAVKTGNNSSVIFLSAK